MKHAIIAFFDNADASHEYRTQQGGWLFLATTGEIIWFNNSFTPTKIITHQATRGLSGELA